MPDPTPESVACPTCGVDAGMPCHVVTLTGARTDFTISGEDPHHAERRLLALCRSRPPNPEWERFAEELEKMAFEIAHSVFMISKDSVRHQHAMIQSAAFESIATIARRISRGGQ